MTDDTTGSLTIDVTTADTEIFYLIASMPEYFEEITTSFQKFPYQMKIKNNLLGLSESAIEDLKVYPNPVSDYISTALLKK